MRSNNNTAKIAITTMAQVGNVDADVDVFVSVAVELIVVETKTKEIKANLT